MSLFQRIPARGLYPAETEDCWSAIQCSKEQALKGNDKFTFLSSILGGKGVLFTLAFVRIGKLEHKYLFH